MFNIIVLRGQTFFIQVQERFGKLNIFKTFLLQIKMSRIISCSKISPVQQQSLSKALTVRSESMKKGQRIFGEPFKTYNISEDKKWLCVPFHSSRTLSCIPKDVQIYDFSQQQLTRGTSMRFTGELLDEVNDRDQKTSMKEAISHLDRYHTVTLGLRTGYGKTICSVYLACHYKLRTIVLCCNSSLVDAWINEFKNNSTCKAAIFKGTTQPKPDVDVIVCMIGQLYKLDDAILNSFGMLVLDEAVDFCTELRIREVLKIHPQKIIVCTATPTRPDKLHVILHQLAGTHMVVRENQKSFSVVKLSTMIKPETISTDQGSDWNFLLYDLFLSEQRNRIILDCILTNYEDHKIMVLTSSVIHVDLLVDLCKAYKLNVTRFAGVQKSYDDGNILIGTTKKMGVGFDEKNKCSSFEGVRCDLLIWVSSTKQPEQLTQFIGRVFRAEMPNVIHFVDNNRSIKSHWRMAKDLYPKLKGTIIDAPWDNFYSVKDGNKFHELYIPIRQRAINTMYDRQEKTGTKVSYLTWLEDQKLRDNIEKELKNNKEEDNDGDNDGDGDDCIEGEADGDMDE
jgi:hypothetical protein